jgi:hypothetical protein
VSDVPATKTSPHDAKNLISNQARQTFLGNLSDSQSSEQGNAGCRAFVAAREMTATAIMMRRLEIHVCYVIIVNGVIENVP